MKWKVSDLFGEPNDMDIMENRREKWIYNHLCKDAKIINYVPLANWFSSGINDTTKKLVFIFNKGVVESFSSITSLRETKVGLIKLKKQEI